MVAGVSYEEAEREVAPHIGKGGLHAIAIEGALARMGFAVQTFWRPPIFGVTTFSPCPFGWPPRPFAPAHIAFMLARGAHFVAVDHEGTILDPSGAAPPDPSLMETIMGVWRTADITARKGD
jgi:hypothetical protein